MTDARPDPDELLKLAEREEAAARRGTLKIFFGYAAGVGKTYAMLQAARREKAEGSDVVVGYVEPHGRAETESLLEGLEALPTRAVSYRGVTLREFDLDAALRRRPGLILVDELAHSNAEGSRHAKRWQDVEELLDAGISVYSTLNVQHVESLNDVIAQITGVVVRETIPDAVVERADEIELIDLTPDELMERLREGKVYVPGQAERALQRFFQRPRLTALREMALRQVAERLNRDVETAHLRAAARAPWATNERLLVCVGPSPTSARLIRTAKRMAAAFGAKWYAAAVETDAGSRPDDRRRIAEHMRLAERLGAECQTLPGHDPAAALIEFAVARNVTKIVVGKSDQPRWRRFLFGTVVDALLDRSGDIDVYVIRGGSDSARPSRPSDRRPAFPSRDYAEAAGVVAACAAAGAACAHFRLSETNIVMLFLLGVAVVASRCGRGPAIASAVVSVLAFDFFFVPPRLTFSVQDAEYVVTFAVMLFIGIVISTLTARLRERLDASRKLHRRTDALFTLTRQLSEVSGPDFLVTTAGRQLRTIFDGEVVIYLRDADGAVEARFGQDSTITRDAVNATVAQWVTEHDQNAGLGTATLPNATALFVPLVGSLRTLGAIGIRANDPNRFADPDQTRMLETCTSLIALALERDQSVLAAGEARVRMEAEEVRNALLSSVSHDLRTPLAVIAGASSRLLDADDDPAVRREFLREIAAESARLTRLVENLLDMTRLESGALTLNRQWHMLEEIIGSALRQVGRDLGSRPVAVRLPPDLPLLSCDGALVEQALVNLLENAARYTPPDTRIEVTAAASPQWVEMRIADTGPGLPAGAEMKALEKFYRGPGVADGRRGAGLGLAICAAIAQVHGGRLIARNRVAGGAEFILSLPCEHAPPGIVAGPESEAAP